MNSNVYPHPGYLYQISRKCDDDIQSTLKETCTKRIHSKMELPLKEKEQKLYVYLIPTASPVDPFNNCRLKTIMNEVDVVVFDTPPVKTGPLQYLCEVLQNYNKEILLRINNFLTESLKSRNIDNIDEGVCDDKEKLAQVVLVKILTLGFNNEGVMQPRFDLNDFTESHFAPTQMERIHKTAEETGKIIEYIEESDFTEKHKELLFDTGILETLIRTVFPEKELFQAFMRDSQGKEKAWNSCELLSSEESEFQSLAEKNPILIDLDEKCRNYIDHSDEVSTLCGKIETYLSSKKKTLLVLQKTPQKFKEFCFPDDANVSVKGPIKEPTGCFWKIKRKDVTVGYLLGSIHAAPNYLLSLNSRIRKCFDKSNRLAVEIDITREDTIKSSNKFWEERYSTLSSEQIGRLSKTLKRLFPKEAEKIDFGNKEEESVFIFKGIAELMSRIGSELGISSGIDLQLLGLASILHKPIEDLETEEQYAQLKTTQKTLSEDPRGLLLEFLLSEEVQELEESTETDEEMKILIAQISIYVQEAFHPIFDAWEEGNLGVFDRSKTYSMDQRIVMTQRNMNMAMRIAKLINEEEKIFCCVGAEHTVGEMNIQAFLSNFGCTTQQVFI